MYIVRAKHGILLVNSHLFCHAATVLWVPHMRSLDPRSLCPLCFRGLLRHCSARKTENERCKDTQFIYKMV